MAAVGQFDWLAPGKHLKVPTCTMWLNTAMATPHWRPFDSALITAE